MGLITGSISLYLAMILIGLVWTLCIVRWGIPSGLQLQDRPHTWARFWSRLPLYCGNQVAVVAVAAIGLSLLRPWFVFSHPGWGGLLVGLVVLFLVDDAWVYIWHRSMHESRWLYNKVHRIHHQSFSPLPFEYLYVHPLEWLVGTIGPFGGMIILVAVQGEMSVWTLWSFVVLRTLHELDVHSGMRSIVGPYIPFFGLTEHHDLHHAKPTKGNYASALTLWDRVFKTYWRPEDDTAQATSSRR